MDVDVLSGPSTSGREAAQSAAALGVDDRARFVVELEFVQCLANPFYLNWLAQNRYLDDPAFLNYLKYLEYWRQPQYARYIRYPHCLLMLQLLQREPFAKAIAVAQVADDIHTQQYYHWQHYHSNRIKEGTAAVEGAAVQQPPPTQPPQAPGAAV